MLVTPHLPLPSHHSAPSILPIEAASVLPFFLAHSEPARVVAATAPALAPAPAVPAPRVGTPPASRTLLPFHEGSSLGPYPCAPLDDCDDIVELDFANTSALGDVNPSERRRPCGRKDAEHSKRNRARERDEIDLSLDVPGNSITPDLDPGSSHAAPAIVGRPSRTPTLPLDSEVPVGWQQLRLPRTRNPALDHLSILVNLITLHPRWRKPPRTNIVRWRNGNGTSLVQQQ